jgi:hypothetical protein
VYILGENNEEIHLDSAIDNRDAAISLAEQARFSLSIFTPDLDPRVFDNAQLERCLFRLARNHQSSEIRILVHDTTLAVKQGHCLIRLAQKLTSSVLIHNPAREHRGELSTFMIVDAIGMLHRRQSNSRNYTAVVNYMSPQTAGELNDLFNEMWERSTVDSQTRRLYI